MPLHRKRVAFPRPGVAKRTQGLDGRVYDSGAEARFADELVLRLRAGDITDYVAQFSIALVGAGDSPLISPLTGRQIRHRVDFRVSFPDGRVELVEIKGVATEKWEIKAAVAACMFSDAYRIVPT